jgi:hypothetical protein
MQAIHKNAEQRQTATRKTRTYKCTNVYARNSKESEIRPLPTFERLSGLRSLDEQVREYRRRLYLMYVFGHDYEAADRRRVRNRGAGHNAHRPANVELELVGSQLTQLS